jgi:hypothetical protein
MLALVKYSKVDIKLLLWLNFYIVGFFKKLATTAFNIDKSGLKCSSLVLYLIKVNRTRNNMCICSGKKRARFNPTSITQ